MSINRYAPDEQWNAAAQEKEDEKHAVKPTAAILVTGGTGFLGSYILRKLIQKGHSVRAIRRKKDLPFYIEPEILKRVEWIQGDVLDPGLMQDAMQGMDGVIHAAAIVSFSGKAREQMYRANVDGTTNVVNTALENNVSRLVHISSVAALGRSWDKETVTEEKKWDENGNHTHYGITKHQSEMQVWRSFAEGLPGVILNPSTILGYGNWHHSSCAIFRNAYNEFPWYTKGTNGFVGVEDVAEVVLRLLRSNINHKRFIVNGDNWSFQHLFNTLADNFHKKRPSKHAGHLASALAWRIEKLKSFASGKDPLLTKETARIGQSQTGFSNEALLKALPGFEFTPLDEVIEDACQKYIKALKNGILTF